MKTNLIGGILSSILLVLGFSILLGGFYTWQQSYNVTAAHAQANLLSLAATSLLIPTASRLISHSSDVNILKQSRGAAIVLVLVYASYLFFQFYSHGYIYTALELDGEPDSPVVNQDEDERKDQSSLSRLVIVVYLTIVVTLTAFCTQFAVDSIDALSQKANVSRPFIGLILLPILNNDLTPVNQAIKNDMRLTMNYTIGKCLQTALFVTPLMVIIAWGMGLDLTLSFDGFEVVSLFSSVLLLNYLIVHGLSTWYDLRLVIDYVIATCIVLTFSIRIQGVLLIADWILIALAAFYAS